MSLDDLEMLLFAFKLVLSKSDLLGDTVLSGYQSDSQSYMESVFANEPSAAEWRFAVYPARATTCPHRGVR